MARFTHRVWNWWNGWAPGSYDTGRPEMGPTEHVVLEAHAIQIRGWLSTKGKLLLTTDRLYFLPFRNPFNPNTRQSLWPDFQITLSEVSLTSHSRWWQNRWALYPGFPRLNVVAYGREVTVIVADYQVWHSRIELHRDRQLRRANAATEPGSPQKPV